MVVGISFISCSLIYLIMLCAVYFTKNRVKTTENGIYAMREIHYQILNYAHKYFTTNE